MQTNNINVILLRSMTRDPPITRIAKTLASNGYSVKLLRWDREPKISKQTGHINYEDHYFCLRAPYGKFYLIIYIIIWQIYQFYFLMRNNCDIIHAADLDTLLPSVLVKCIKKKKIAYIIYDLYGGNFKNYYISRILSKIEKFAIRFADVLFLVDEDRYEQVKGAKINKLAYIYNSPEDYYPTVRSTSSLKSEFIIFYAGYIDRIRGLEEVIDAVKDLAGVKFIIAGIGPDKDIIEQKVANLDSIRYIGLISYEEVIKRISDADMLFAFYDPIISNNRYASPNKLFEAMMCGKPIIVNDGTSMTNIVRKENCGLVVPYDDIDAIKDAILKLKNNSNLRQKLGENGRRAYEEKYNWSIMEKRLIHAYKKIEREI